MGIQFDGQQTDEHVLYEVSPHPFTQKIAIIRNTVLAIFFFAVIYAIAQTASFFTGYIIAAGFLVCVLIITVSIWWNNTVSARDRTYITDRRIIRFAVVTPFFRTKRALFWTEALKAKAYAPNVFYKSMNIGTLEVEPVMGEEENVRVNDVYYYEDLGNYIDKILYTVKNKPGEITSIKPFVPKPRGKRD